VLILNKICFLLVVNDLDFIDLNIDNVEENNNVKVGGVEEKEIEREFDYENISIKFKSLNYKHLMGCNMINLLKML
jgi:hypothetical protein